MTDTYTPPPRRRAWLWIIVLVLLAGGAAFWWFNTHKSSDMSDSAKASSDSAGPPGGGHGGKHGGGGANGPVPVAVATAEKGDMPITRQGLGTVTPLTNIVIQTQISGVITQIAFQEGQIVQKGDLLIEIDPRPYEIAEQQAEGALIRDQALLKEAQLDLERYRKLVAQDSIAKQQLDAQQSLVDQDLGNVQTDQAQIDSAKLNLVYCHITAPVTGRVGLRQVDQGNYVQVGGNSTTGLVTLTQLQPITVIFPLPEDDLPAIMKRLNEGAALAVTVYDRNDSTKLAEGKLVAVDNQIDVTTGTFKIRAQFDNTDNALFPNQFVNATLLVDTLHDTVLVPSAAIQRGAPGTFVYLLNDKKVALKVVKLGPSQGDTIAVTDGLSPGDQVVTDGADKLRDGSEVSVKSPKDKDDKSPKDDSTKDKKDDTIK